MFALPTDAVVRILLFPLHNGYIYDFISFKSIALDSSYATRQGLWQTQLNKAKLTINCIVLLWTTITLLSFAFIAQTLYRGSGRCELYFRLAQLYNVCLQPVTSLTVH